MAQEEVEDPEHRGDLSSSERRVRTLTDREQQSPAHEVFGGGDS